MHAEAKENAPPLTMSANHIKMSGVNIFGANPRFMVRDCIYPDRTYGPRIQPNLELTFVFEGDFRVRIDGQDHYLGPRQATLLLPGREEFFSFSHPGHTRHGWCVLMDPQVDRRLLEAYGHLPFSVPFTPRMESLATMALSLNDPTRGYERRLQHALAQAIFFEFLTQAGFVDDESEPLPVSVLRVREHIQSSFAAPCNLDALAKIAGVTGPHLIHLFRKHLGVTPIDYLWKTRIDHGTRLLKETGLSISEIAFRSGFQDPYHFSKVVKKQLGISPREYRKAALQEMHGKA